MEVENKKPLCKFGVKCYRKNPKHFDVYSHPEGLNVKQEGKVKAENKETVEATANNSSKKRMRQTTLEKDDLSPTVKSPVCDEKNTSSSNEKKRSRVEKLMKNRTPLSKERAFKKKRKDLGESIGAQNLGAESGKDSTDALGGISMSDESVPSTSVTLVSHKSNERITSSWDPDLKNKTVQEIIKTLFLVNMPPDFYSFYEFNKSVEESVQLKEAGLKLVGPFHVLSGQMDHSIDQDLFVCHWRYYYDPPEFQTVLSTDSGFHMGYWRDDPNENPVFMASNNPNKNCTFKVEAENIFGSVFHYLNEFIKNCDPFNKVKITELQNSLSNWAKKNKFSLEKKTTKMQQRQKKVVSKTFHGLGIVVPVESKTDLGYRPLIETDENLKKICKLIMAANDENEKESLWDNLQPLITAANIANDECDFGNSLELGIDLFCMGSPLFHEVIEHLLSTAYSLLNRSEFEKIIKTHLKHRRKGNNMSVCS